MRTKYGDRMLAKARRKYGKPDYPEKSCSVKIRKNMPEDGGERDYKFCIEKDEKLNEVWEEIKKVIKDEVSPVSYETWIEPCEPICILDNKMVLQVENAFFKEMLERRYLCYLKRATAIVLCKRVVEVEVVTFCL